MDNEFERDMTEAVEGLADVRDELKAALGGMTDADLGRQRRGGWDIAGVIQHIVDSEWHYAGLVARLRQDLPPTAPAITPPVSIRDALSGLGVSRTACIDSFEGVSEEDFYRLGQGGGQDYSVLSVLQNVRQHDIEHGEQVQRIKDTTS